MKTILVTGASTGIGEAIAVHLDRLGHRVYAGVRREVDADRLRAGASSRLTPVILDVTDEAQVDAAAKQIASENDGCLDGVVNNAGIAKGGPIEFLDLGEWREQLEVNVLGQLAVTKAVLPLIRAGSGRIVFIGSMSGKVASAMTGPYNASKFALEGIADSLRLELHPWRIPVIVVEPGAIKTPIWEKGRQSADRIEEDLPAEGRRLYAQHIAAVRKGIDVQEGKGIGPEKVAEAVEHALLASRPRTRYPVGLDAKVATRMVRLLPDRAVGAIVRRIGGP